VARGSEPRPAQNYLVPSVFEQNSGFDSWSIVRQRRAGRAPAHGCATDVNISGERQALSNIRVVCRYMHALTLLKIPSGTPVNVSGGRVYCGRNGNWAKQCEGTAPSFITH
jgi:hypothetical protein